jgi:hypothetical protein
MLKRKLSLAASLGAVVLLLLAGQANAGPLFLHGLIRGLRSRSSSHYNNGGGNYGGTVTTTRPDGQTAIGTFNRTDNNGTITTNRDYTGFGGRTASETVTHTPGEGGTATYTGRHGNTYTAARRPYANGNGNFGRTTKFTGPNGGTRTQQFSQTNDGNGAYTDSRTTTYADGQSHTGSYTWGAPPQ